MKKTIMVSLILAVIIILIILGFKSCNPRKKIITTQDEEYSAFINANTEFTCELIKNQALSEDNSESQDRLNEIYAKYKFQVDDDDAMLEILKKYENNAEVAAIIQANTQSCLQGGNPIFYKTTND